MEWYLPITIIPGIGMLINSTTTQIMALSSEINILISLRCNDFQHRIADRKIKQLSLVTKANLFLYISIAFYVFSGIIAVTTVGENSLLFSNISLYTGTLTLFISLILLIFFSFRAVKIRKDQFEHGMHH